MRMIHIPGYTFHPPSRSGCAVFGADCLHCDVAALDSFSSSREIRGRIGDQANKLISHFYGLGAYLSAF